MLDEIVKRTRWLKKQMEKELPYLHQEVSDILESKSRAVDRIEKTLDVLLNYSQMGLGEKEFKRLNSYYASFNPENAKFYADHYKEMNEGE
jgi:hypothetical protein